VEQTEVMGKIMPTVTIAFHGTNAQFEVFSPERSGTGGLGNAEYGEAYFFTDNRDVAGEYARAVAAQNGGLPVILTAQIYLSNPLVFDFGCDDRSVLNIDDDSLGDDALVQEELIALAREGGHDGLIGINFNDGGDGLITQYVAFKNNQVRMVEWVSCLERRTSREDSPSFETSLSKQWDAAPATGEHYGTIRAISDTEVIQHVGQGRHVAWQRTGLTGASINVDDQVQINANGQVQASRPQFNDLGL
jgi:hypothetical protein